MAHVSPMKKELVEKMAEEFGRSKVVGIINIQGIPAAQFQKMRRKLRNKVNLKVAKSNLIAIALDQASAQKKGLEKLKKVISGQTAVVTAEINPFKLFKEMEATKTRAPARGGEVAPEEIWVREGETPFKPGPIVGDLQKAGIPAAIERGKVVIKKDKLLVSKGDRIPRIVAQAITRLEIYPITVGLDLRGAYEEGMVYGRDVLAVDETKVLADIHLAGLSAFNLALNIAYPTKPTIVALLSMAHLKALTLAVDSGVATEESLPLIIAKARSQMLALASLAPSALDDELKGMVSKALPSEKPPEGEEQKKEDKKEDKKAAEEEAASGLGALFG